VGAFQNLAAEEQKHIEFIQSQIDALDKGQAPNVVMVPDLPVLRMAYLIERDLAEFYAMAAAKAQGEARQVLDMLDTWEHGHEKLFKYLHDQAFEEYAKMPWGG